MRDVPKNLTSLQDDDYIKLLDLIDELRLRGAEEYVSLPQLVVCGDQSAGKSSVLEALSGIAFPVKSGTCTRFATEVCLRRNAREAASACIIPDPEATADDKKRQLDFQERDASLDQLPTIIQAAKTAIGISETIKVSRAKLRLEIQGPHLPNFTLTDLPGIMHSTNEKENDMVDDMTLEYMKKERCVILAIVNTGNDVSNQGVLNLVRRADLPENRTVGTASAESRTVGIITKPDLIGGRETEFTALAMNKTFYLRRGWHVVRTQGPGDPTPFERTAAEQQAFGKLPWSDLPPDRLGIDHLRNRLREALFDEIRNNLKDVVRQIEEQKTACDAELSLLGPSRASRDAKVRFLLDIQDNFKSIVEDGVAGRYQKKYLNRNPNERLRNTIRQLNDDFSAAMQDFGHKYHISDMMAAPTNLPRAIKPPESMTAASFLQMVEEKILDSGRSQELPNHYDTYLSSTVFRLQSQGWENHAKDYLKAAFNSTRNFLLNALKSVTTDQSSSLLWHRLIMPELEKRLAALHQKLQELLKPYSEVQPYSTPRRYNRNLYDYRKQWDDLMSSPKTNIKQIKQLKNGAACIELMLDTLAYYDNALETFTDNLISLAVENCLLEGLPNLVSSNTIATMSDADLARYAGESEDTVTRRAHAEQKQRTLQASLDILEDQLWTSASMNFDPRNTPNVAKSPDEICAPERIPASSVPATAESDNASQSQSSGDNHVPREIGSKGAYARTSESGDTVLRRDSGSPGPQPPRTPEHRGRSFHSQSDLHDQAASNPRTPTVQQPAFLSPETSSHRASAAPENSLTPDTKYSSPHSSSGSRRDWRRRSYGKASPQPKVAVSGPSSVSGSDSGRWTFLTEPKGISTELSPEY
jgi:GTPase SAR1 family protein